jgi:peptidyl-prolyl cis-trans isomerase SurA
MILLKSNAVWRWTLGAVALMAMPSLVHDAASAQVAQPSLAQEQKSGTPRPQGEALDRVVAVVNGDVILESDIDEERRFEEIQPYFSTNEFTRQRAVNRLIDRTLILQQAAVEPADAVTGQELDAQLLMLRRDIPACKQYHCETDEGWKKYISDHGFTEEEFRGLWRKRMELLKFIEVRFRNGIKISDAEITTYYEKTMLPAYVKRNVTPPKLDVVSKRIEEVLLQQQVSALLEDWLKSLRAQGSVRMVRQHGVTP